MASGHGFLGICAGAYAGCNYVNGLYQGWGVAPDVHSLVYNQIGNLLINPTSSGSKVMGVSGTLTMYHWNGPALYASGNNMISFATYANGAYKGYSAIVGDTYGKGRSVLSGPHPELTPQNPTLLANLIVWAANIPTNLSTNTYTVSQVATAANNVKTFIDTNKTLPNYVTVSTTKISIPQYLYLATSTLINVNSGSMAATTLKTVNSPNAPSGTYKSGNISKTEYISIANYIQSYINTNCKAPNNVASSLGNIPYATLIYMYSKLMNFYNTNQRLANYVSI